MRSLFVYSAVLLDIFYSVTTAEHEFRLRNVVPVKNINHPDKLKINIETLRSVLNQDISTLKYGYDNGDLFDPAVPIDVEPLTLFNTLEPKLSPMLVNWVNMYDLGVHNPQVMNGDNDKVSSSTSFPVEEQKTTTTITITTTTTEETEATADLIALKCVKWVKCQEKTWPQRKNYRREISTPLTEVKRTS